MASSRGSPTQIGNHHHGAAWVTIHGETKQWSQQEDRQHLEGDRPGNPQPGAREAEDQDDEPNGVEGVAGP